MCVYSQTPKIKITQITVILSQHRPNTAMQIRLQPTPEDIAAHEEQLRRCEFNLKGDLEAITVKLPPSLASSLRFIAAQSKTNQSEIVREGLIMRCYSPLIEINDPQLIEVIERAIADHLADREARITAAAVPV
jgi:hypothetical protein